MTALDDQIDGGGAAGHRDGGRSVGREHGDGVVACLRVFFPFDQAGASVLKAGGESPAEPGPIAIVPMT
jgi:hypothetical protein